MNLNETKWNFILVTIFLFLFIDLQTALVPLPKALKIDSSHLNANTPNSNI